MGESNGPAEKPLHWKISYWVPLSSEGKIIHRNTCQHHTLTRLDWGFGVRWPQSQTCEAPGVSAAEGRAGKACRPLPAHQTGQCKKEYLMAINFFFEARNASVSFTFEMGASSQL